MKAGFKLILATANSMYIKHLDWDSSVQVQNYFNIEPWKENKAGFRAYVAYYQQYKKLDLELSVRIRNYSNIGLRDLRDQCWFPSLGGLLPNNIWYSDPELYRNWPLRLMLASGSKDKWWIACQQLATSNLCNKSRIRNCLSGSGF